MNKNIFKLNPIRYINIKSEKLQIIVRIITIASLLLFISLLVVVNIRKFDDTEEDIDTKLDNLKIESTEENTIIGTPSVIKYFEDNKIILTFNGISKSTYDIERDGLSFKIGNDVMDIYEYDGTRKAKDEVASISKRFDSRKIEGQVHFYRKNNLIVAYEGSNKIILNLLQSAFGPQFTGE